MSNQLTPTQHAILSHALAQTQGKLLWFPDALKGGAKDKVIDSLRRGGLIAQIKHETVVTKAGYEAAMKEAKLKPQSQVGEWSMDSGYEISKSIDYKKQNITAVFAASDHLALGVLRDCHERKISVPQELNIIGFDDLPEAEFAWPPLSTMRQNFQAIGEGAVSLLLNKLHDERLNKSEPLTATLVERATTAKRTK